MSEHANNVPVVAERPDDRTDGPTAGGERAVLEHYLARAQETVLLKVAGLDAEQLARRSVSPSSMSLLGIVRHLTEVQTYWLRVVLLDDQGVVGPYSRPDRHDADFDDGHAATAAADLTAYEAGLVTTRANTTAWPDLDRPVRGLRNGEPVNLRWILTHLVEEYARHLGHMDLLRESIDGQTGC